MNFNVKMPQAPVLPLSEQAHAQKLEQITQQLKATPSAKEMALSTNLQADTFVPSVKLPSKNVLGPVTNEVFEQKGKEILNEVLKPNASAREMAANTDLHVDIPSGAKDAVKKISLKQLGIAGAVVAALVAGGFAIKHFVIDKKAPKAQQAENQLNKVA